MRAALILTLILAPSLPAEEVASNLQFERGAVNRCILSQGEHKLAVYGAKPGTKGVERVLVTHHRRDVVWAARHLEQSGSEIVAPAEEQPLFQDTAKFWTEFTKTRFHDYGQQSTKILRLPMKVGTWVKSDDELTWRGTKFTVLSTPGFTRGSVSYVATIGDKKIAFTGDLIYGDGQILDLYSFQDQIKQANIRGYHGYGSRLAQLVTSLKSLMAAQPDLLVPARGPLIRKPQASMKKLLDRVQKLYRNYLSTNALYWYFKKDRMTTCAERILGKGAKFELLPYALHQKAPDWVFEQGTSRLLISDNGNAFLLDCGYQRIIDTVKKLMQQGLVKKVEGIFVTHYHDDHTDMVQTASEEFGCPIYALEQYADVLRNPNAYHLPAMTANPMKKVKVVKSGHRLKWHEFELTFHFFPGQTYYHGALFAKKKGERPIMFVGDAFSPSGMDDYCVLNRNLAHEDDGYLRCLRMLNEIKEDYWLVNEHIPFVFSFSPKEMDYLESRFRKRVSILAELFPWDDPNYGIDEQWAFFYPYGSKVKAGTTFQIELRLINHSPVAREFRVRPHSRGSLKILSQDKKRISLKPGEKGKIAIKVQAGEKAGTHLVTADIASKGMAFNDWSEALITVE